MIDRQKNNVLRLFALALCVATLTISGCNNRESAKITLTAEMIINEVAKGDASLLIDEQGTSDGFPVHFPKTRWSIQVPVGEPSWYLPANAVIDLRRDYVITHIYIFHGDGQPGRHKINYGIPFQWSALISDSVVATNKWIDHKFPKITTRFLQISKQQDSDLREIILYGYPAGNAPAPSVGPTGRPDPVTLDQAIGVNTHYQDPFNRVKVAGIAREYHNWILNEGGFTKDYPGYPKNSIQWNPGSPMQKENESIPSWSAQTPGGYNFDKYYKEMKEAGITVFPCIQGTVPWLSGELNTKSRHKPVKEGKDPADPFSYAEHADFMFQYAARYGKRKVQDQLLKAAPGQNRQSGLGYLEYYENWNEPDGWWGGRRDYFTPYEYAAMSSADFDGHESRMGKDKGVRNADPNAKLVMSGIAIPNVDYLRAMKFWFEYHRTDKRFVFDVITVHHYCNATGSQAVMTEGISPEEDGLRYIVEKIAKFRDENVPEREVWVTEFGWDTNPVTPQSAPSSEIQGRWLVRAYLECFAGGIDRVMMYMLRDVDPQSRIQFSSSGLIGPLGDFSAKPSWYYVQTLRTQLTGMIFDRELKSSDDRVRIYRFKAPVGKRSVLAIWCPDDSDSVADFSLDVDEDAHTATIVSLADGKANGSSRAVQVTNKKISVDVSPSPIFISIPDPK